MNMGSPTILATAISKRAKVNLVEASLPEIKSLGGFKSGKMISVLVGDIGKST